MGKKVTFIWNIRVTKMHVFRRKDGKKRVKRVKKCVFTLFLLILIFLSTGKIIFVKHYFYGLFPEKIDKSKHYFRQYYVALLYPVKSIYSKTKTIFVNIMLPFIYH